MLWVSLALLDLQQAYAYTLEHTLDTALFGTIAR